MRIAVVDVAAEKSGALSVLCDFYEFVKSSEQASAHEWYFITSGVKFDETENIKIISVPKTKSSQIYRLYWDNCLFKKLDKVYKFDVVFSLQNAAVRAKAKKQVVYFHNVLMFEPKGKYSLLKSNERNYAIYTKFLGPYTKRTLKRADTVIAQTNISNHRLKEKFKLKCDVKTVNPNISNLSVENINQDRIKGFIYPANAVIFKNHKLIVEAVKHISENKDFEVIFTFKGNENPTARSLKASCEGIEQVNFTGLLPREKVFEYYKDHAIIWASELESYPIPFIEAMSFGGAVVVPEEPYAKEILGKYDNAYFYPVGDSEKLAEIMLDVLNNPVKQVVPVTSDLHNTWQDVLDIILN